ncbi:MAG TPA: virulence factor [Metalysinibacillus jejuensis]|uniref:Virulence factor n=1 Tax=Metalysinibacillus jejuensis TaxID=914327 RepID=A0A921T682_9BACL|nr:virulence factor [Metalysinibacillus jejuensis]
MKIIKIEPTPSPNSMKIVVDHELPFGETYNYTKAESGQATGEIKALLEIEGVRGVFRVADFFAVERNAKFTWEAVLKDVRAVFGEATEDVTKHVSDTFGEVYVHVQTYKNIPLQVKAFSQDEEKRVAMPERFVQAFEATIADEDDENYIFLRKWLDYGVRYGDLLQVAQEVAKELDLTMTDDKLTALQQAALAKQEPLPTRKMPLDFETFTKASSEERFVMLDTMSDPTVADLPTLAVALQDEKMSVRRLATVYLGMVEDEAVVPHIIKALHDKSAAVRRTAGDCVSDLGFAAFEPSMMAALQDKNKLVRWRAAMFLFETGTEQALPALRAALDDKEFEVKLQVEMAIARIEGGEEAQGSVWKQMMER